MTEKTSRQQKKNSLQLKINQFFEDSYFDIQGLSPTSGATMDEQYLARVLTKLAVGSATVWWSLLEVKDFLVLRRKAKKIHDVLP